AEVRNEADSMCYMVERQIAELGERVTAANKSKAESLIADLRQKAEQKADTEILKNLMNELRGVLILLQQDANQQTAGAGAGSHTSNGSGDGSSSSSSSSSTGDDVIDAEVRSAD